MTVGPDDEHGDDGGTERPSKSARKRAAHAAQDLGEALLGLPDAELSALELPEALREALRLARRIRSRAALAARSERDARETERFRRIENWRERLITEGEPALEELAHWYPAIDVSAWRRRVSAARAERDRTGGAAGTASRELFRALRAMFATMPP